jgi:peptide-methionine (S)-S-oxide reductase
MWSASVGCGASVAVWPAWRWPFNTPPPVDRLGREQPDVARAPTFPVPSSCSSRGDCTGNVHDVSMLGKLMMVLNPEKTRMPSAQEALPGRSEPAFEVPERHAVLGTPLKPPFPEGIETAYFALGCFWGAEQLFWVLDGVYTTAVGYMNGTTPNPTYEEVCSGRTGHAEAVLVAFDAAKITYADLLKVFFEEHDPTQGMRQGNDVGTQYRSGIYFTGDAQKATAETALRAYDEALRAAGREPITTEVEPAGPFYYAEDYHQQYLHKVPNGYCGLAGTGVSCRIPAAAT